MAIFLLIVGLVLFIFLVVIHEFGHFVVARRNGVEAEEFGLFFPPRLYKRQISPKRVNWRGKFKPLAATKPFLFSINLLPLGGFVKMKGEHDSDTAPGSFGAASLWAKSKIMVAGVVMNLVVAVILFMILALIGMPKLIPNQFTVKSDTKIIKNEIIASFVEPNSPASLAGLKNDDQILAIGPPGRVQKINGTSELDALTKKYAGQDVSFTYLDKGNKITKKVRLRSDKAVAGTNKGHLGVAPLSLEWRRSTWSAPIVAIGLTGQLTKLTFVGLGHALSGLGGIIAGGVTGNSAARQNAQSEASSQVAGPVGVFYILKSGSSLGYRFMLMIIAVVSLTLAIMNILPIPALDGGRLWWTLGAHAIRRPMTARVEEMINATGFVILLALIVLVTIVDVHRF